MDNSFNNQPYGDDQNFSNQPYGQPDFSNNPYGNQDFSNQPYGNQNFSNQPYGQQDFSNQGYNNNPYGQPGYNQGYGQMGPGAYNPYQQNYSTGFQTPYSMNGQPLPVKSKVTAGVLYILLGGIGVGNFYMGKIALGILDVLFCLTLIPAIVNFIRGIIILAQSPAEFAQKYNVIPED